MCPIIDSACGEGSCTSSAATGTNCLCPEGFTGFGCSEKCGLELGNEACPDPCDPNPCFNGGTCIARERDGLADFVCNCPSTPEGLDAETLCGPPTPRIFADPMEVPANATIGTDVGKFEAYNAAPGVLEYYIRDVQPSVATSSSSGVARRLRRSGPASVPEFTVDSSTGVLRTASDLGVFSGSSFDVFVVATLRYGLLITESQPAAMPVAVTPVAGASSTYLASDAAGGCGGGCVAGVVVGLLLLLLLLLLWWFCCKDKEDEKEAADIVPMQANPMRRVDNPAFEQPTETSRTQRVPQAAVVANDPNGSSVYDVAGGAAYDETPEAAASRGQSMYDIALGGGIARDREGSMSNPTYATAAQGGPDRGRAGSISNATYALAGGGGGGGGDATYALAAGNHGDAVANGAYYDTAGNTDASGAVYDVAGQGGGGPGRGREGSISNATYAMAGGGGGGNDATYALAAQGAHGEDSPLYATAAQGGPDRGRAGSISNATYAMAGGGSGGNATYALAGGDAYGGDSALYATAAQEGDGGAPLYDTAAASGSDQAVYDTASQSAVRTSQHGKRYSHHGVGAGAYSAASQEPGSAVYQLGGNGGMSSNTDYNEAEVYTPRGTGGQAVYDIGSNTPQGNGQSTYDVAGAGGQATYDVAAAGGGRRNPAAKPTLRAGGPKLRAGNGKKKSSAPPPAAVYDIGNNNQQAMPVYDIGNNQQANYDVAAASGAGGAGGKGGGLGRKASVYNGFDGMEDEC